MACCLILAVLAAGGCGSGGMDSMDKESSAVQGEAAVGAAEGGAAGSGNSREEQEADTENDTRSESPQGSQGEAAEEETADGSPQGSQGEAAGSGNSREKDSEGGAVDGSVQGSQDTASEKDTGSGSSQGALSVKGTKLVDSSGSQVQLRGVSTHGLAWYPEYVNEACFRQLKEEWGINVIRLAMYTAEYGGYCTGGDQEELKNLVKSGVEYAANCGLYVIIDWHILSDGNPNTYLEEAKAFFDEMSEEYADYTNVIYEICNEPNGGTSWSQVKEYAAQVIPVIRENDEDGIILVGTPNWCQYVEDAAADPLEDCSNVMYTLHFYAATHRESLRSALVSALEAGLPVFVSEYGICDASGSGAVDEVQADQWVELLDEHKISYVAWNLSNKSETSAFIQGSCGKTSGFAWEELTDSGKWLCEMLTGKENGFGSSAGDTSQGPQTESAQPSQESPADSAGTSQSAQEDSGLTVSAEVTNSWQQEEKTFYQYNLKITNTGETARNDWSVCLGFSGDITLNNGWNGNYHAQGSTLTITSMDYNGYIGAGESVENIGFIIQGAEGLVFQGLR